MDPFLNIYQILICTPSRQANYLLQRNVLPDVLQYCLHSHTNSMFLCYLSHLNVYGEIPQLYNSVHIFLGYYNFTIANKIKVRKAMYLLGFTEMISSETFKLRRGSEFVWGRERPVGANRTGSDRHRQGPTGCRARSWEGLAKL